MYLESLEGNWDLISFVNSWGRPIRQLIGDLNEHVSVILSASDLGYVESALEAQVLAREVLDAIRSELLKPVTTGSHPYRDMDS
jgi:hypothetical protein